MTEKSTIELVTDVINWYRNIKSDFNDVDLLLRTQREFAARLYDLANEVWLLHKQRNQTEFQKKAAFAREKQKRLPPVCKSVSQAEIEAEIAVENLFKMEQEAESEYIGARLLLEHAGNVLQAMVQHLSYLKKEKRDEMAGNGSQQT